MSSSRKESRRCDVSEDTANQHQEERHSLTEENQKPAPILPGSDEQHQPATQVQEQEGECGRLICEEEAGVGLQRLDTEAVPRSKEGAVRTFKRRWLTLLVFCLFSLGSAYQWIHMSIIGNVVLRYYNDSLPGTSLQKETAVDWLSMIYFLSYLVAFLPVLWILDSKVKKEKRN